jgi:hypothetical protein
MNKPELFKRLNLLSDKKLHEFMVELYMVLPLHMRQDCNVTFNTTTLNRHGGDIELVVHAKNTKPKTLIFMGFDLFNDLEFEYSSRLGFCNIDMATVSMMLRKYKIGGVLEYL